MGDVPSACSAESSQAACRCNRGKARFPADAPVGLDARTSYDVGGSGLIGQAKPKDHQSANSEGLAIEAGARAKIFEEKSKGNTRSSVTAAAISSSSSVARSRQDTLTRGSTWLEMQLELKDPCSTACEILRMMLEQDELGPGQRADLEYIERVLIDLQCTGEKLDGSVKGHVQVMEKDANVDDTTLEYLKTFADHGPKRKHKTFREVAQAIYFTQSLRRRASYKKRMTEAHRMTHIIPNSDSSLLKALEELDNWNVFDVFYIARLTSAAVLQYVGLVAMQNANLMPQFNISLPKLRVFLAEIEKQYLANPYHNSLHAADVVQTVYAMIRAVPESSFSEIEIMTALFAGICHDVGHGGVTNSFRVASLDEGALTYNDISVNEHMHCSITYRTLLRGDECNWLDGLTSNQAVSVRKMFIDIVLATDMQFHFAKVQKLNALFEEKGSELYKWESAMPYLELLVHGADISNPTKPHHVALKWTDRVLEEFFAQGDEERRLGRVCSPLCDRHSVSKAGSQNGFIEFIVQPTIEVLAKLCDLRIGLKNIKEYRAYWQQVLQEEKEAAEVLPCDAEKAEKLAKISGEDRVKNIKEKRPPASKSASFNLPPPVRGLTAGLANPK